MKILLLILVLGLPACVYVPRTTARYDAGCQFVERHMTLEATQVASFGGCRNEGCLALLAASGAIAAASAVVSGSIVVAGNVVYWFEERGQCRQLDVAPLPNP
jgi:hypothetical protein